MCVCVCVCVCKIGPISARTLSFRHQTSRKFFSHSNFPIPYLWTAFCVPLSFVFYEKNNNLEWRNVLKTLTVMCVCVCAKFDQFLPVRSHFDPKRPVNFFHIVTFPSPTFGPLFAFHCPLFFTKNNNLECRDVLKTVTVTSDQKRFGPYTPHN